jgi:DNA-binding protein HU-beta
VAGAKTPKNPEILDKSCENPGRTVFRRANPALRSAPATEGADMQTQMTKSQLIAKIAELRELAKKDVRAMMEALTEVGHKELKKTGVFVVPGFAKFVVIKKPATKARKGINPFTGQEMMFKAKPARKIVRARPVKAAKEAV